MDAAEPICAETPKSYYFKIDYIEEITINNEDQGENDMNVFIRSNTGNFQVNGLSSTFQNSDIFGAKSINVIQNTGYIEIKAKTGEHIYLYTHIINPRYDFYLRHSFHFQVNNQQNHM